MLAFAAHPGVAALDMRFSWDPLALATIGVASVLYSVGLVRLWRSAGAWRGMGWLQVGSFFAGLLTLGVALVSPLDRLSDYFFAAHMTQHELLMVLAAPLIVLGRPLVAYVWALPQPSRVAIGRLLQRPALQWSWQFLSAPLLVLVLHAATRWIWHVPAFFEGAMRHEALHAFQHFTFFMSAALFWWALIHGRYGRAGYGVAVLFVFATAVHTSVLGALISVAPRLLYPIYGPRVAGLGYSALEDQELAGLIMWVPSGALLLFTALALFAAWLGEAERRARRVVGESVVNPWRKRDAHAPD